MERGGPFPPAGGGVLTTTAVSELHRSLKVPEPQRKEGSVKDINQKYLWDVRMPTWNRLSAQIAPTLNNREGFQTKSREEIHFVLSNALSF